MNISIRLRLALFGLAAMLMVGALAAGISLYFFRMQIESLYRQDFTGRIRGIEFQYADVDAVSAASDEVEALQNDLLRQLQRRFEGERGARPFIMNGTGQIILWPDDTGLDRDLAENILGRAEGEQDISVTLESEAGPVWFFARYYPPWDWYTGYAVPEADRFSLFRRFLWVLITATLALSVLAFGVYFLALRRMLRPLQSVQEALEHYSNGDLRIRLSATGNDEIGKISRGNQRVCPPSHRNCRTDPYQFRNKRHH
jgi:HAMP domain-containing protein